MDEDNAEDGKVLSLWLMIEFDHATYFARG
jgi:hypothetical protein